MCTSSKLTMSGDCVSLTGTLTGSVNLSLHWDETHVGTFLVELVRLLMHSSVRLVKGEWNLFFMLRVGKTSHRYSGRTGVS